ncbi:MAG TPA: hypothetical protein VLK37_06440 [Solirubrobacterales bacterium]|nr:hypothetical protein [Solirubrobacterales bacterium]
MARKIEMSGSEFAQVLACFGDPCSTAIPGGEPEAIPPDPESCQHWIEMVYVLKAADLAIAQSSNQGGGGRALATIVDDFCGTPPRWPLPWPKRKPFKREALSAVQLLAAAARFQEAADSLDSSQELAEVADQLFEAGLGRFAEQGPR